MFVSLSYVRTYFKTVLKISNPRCENVECLRCYTSRSPICPNPTQTQILDTHPDLHRRLLIRWGALDQRQKFPASRFFCKSRTLLLYIKNRSLLHQHRARRMGTALAEGAPASHCHINA